MPDSGTAHYARGPAHGRSGKNGRNRLILEELVGWRRGITCPSGVTGAEGKYTHPNGAGAARIEGGGPGAGPGPGQGVQAQVLSSEERGGFIMKARLVWCTSRQTDQERSRRESPETGPRVKIIYSTMRAAFKLVGTGWLSP